MAALMGAIFLIFISLGTASLVDPPLIPIVAGAVLGGLTLLLTRGRLVLVRRGRDREVAPPPAQAGADATSRPAQVGVVDKGDLTVVPLDSRTSSALACAVTGIFMFNLIFGTLGIVLGLISLRRGTPGRWGRPAAVTAVALGLIDLIVLAAIMIPQLSDGTLQLG